RIAHPLSNGHAFGVRRPGAAFSALEPENVKLDFNEPSAKCKAGKAVPGRRTPKASPVSSYLITYNRVLFAHSSDKSLQPATDREIDAVPGKAPSFLLYCFKLQHQCIG